MMNVYIFSFFKLYFSFFLAVVNILGYELYGNTSGIIPFPFYIRALSSSLTFSPHVLTPSSAVVSNSFCPGVALCLQRGPEGRIENVLFPHRHFLNFNF